MTKIIKIEIPKWAEWKVKPTILERVQQLVEELPKDYKFYPEIIHNKLTTDKRFQSTSFRRTHESLRILQERNILYHDSTKREYFVSVGGNKVKLYRIV